MCRLFLLYMCVCLFSFFCLDSFCLIIVSVLRVGYSSLASPFFVSRGSWFYPQSFREFSLLAAPCVHSQFSVVLLNWHLILYYKYAQTSVRPFHVVDQLSSGLCLVWRYQPSFNGSGRNTFQTRTNSEESTDEVDVPARTAILWSSEANLSLNSAGVRCRAPITWKTRICSPSMLSPSICFLSSAKESGVRGSGGVKDFTEGKDCCWLTSSSCFV